MSRTSLFLFSVVIIGISSSSAAAQADTTVVAVDSVSRVQITVARRSFEHAFELHNARRIESMMETGAHLESQQFVVPAGPSGRRTFAALAAALEASESSFVAASLDFSAPDAAWEEGRFRIIGRNRSFDGMYRLEWHRSDRGEWKIRWLRMY